MKRLMQMLRRLVSRESSHNADERYLAQSVDAHEFEIRIQALERSRV
jgi:hypothetical protein